MNRCKFCGLLYEKEVREGTPHHLYVCKSDSVILMLQLREILNMEFHDYVYCNACHKEIPTSMFIKHLEQSHPQAVLHIQNFIEKQAIPEDTIVKCNICTEEFPAFLKTIHYSLLHPGNMSIVRQISDTFNSTEKPDIPVLQLCRFCGCEFIKGKKIQHLSNCQGESVVLVRQLRDRIRTAHIQPKPFSIDRCKACGERFPKTKLVDHIAEFHPSTMDLAERLTERVESTSNKYAQVCNLCGRLFITSKLPNHYTQSHPESLAMALQISEKFKSSDFKRNFSSASQYRHSSKKCLPGNKNIAVVTGVPKVIGKIAKKKTLLNKSRNYWDKQRRLEIIKANFNQKQRHVEGEVNVAASDNVSRKYKKFQPLGKPNKGSELNFKARNNKQVGVAHVFSMKKHMPQETDNKRLYVRLQRMSFNLYQECMINGYVVLQDDNCDQVITNLQANTGIVLTKETIEGRYETCSGKYSFEKTHSQVFDQLTLDVSLKNFNPYVKVERLSMQTYQAHISEGYLVVQEEDDDFTQSLVNHVRETVDNSMEFAEVFKNSLNLFIDSEGKNSIGIADLKMFKGRVKTSNNVLLTNLWEDMIKINNKKENKKEILHCQKLLKQFVLQHPEIPPGLKDKLIHARKYLTDPKSKESFLNKFLSIKKVETRITVRVLLNKLLSAMKF